MARSPLEGVSLSQPMATPVQGQAGVVSKADSITRLGQLGVDLFREVAVDKPAREEAQRVRESFINKEAEANATIEEISKSEAALDGILGVNLSLAEAQQALGGVPNEEQEQNIGVLRDTRSKLQKLKKAAYQRRGETDREFYIRASVSVKQQIDKAPGLAADIRRIYQEELGFDPYTVELDMAIKAEEQKRERESLMAKKQLELALKTPYAAAILNGTIDMFDPKVSEAIMEDSLIAHKNERLDLEIKELGYRNNLSAMEKERLAAMQTERLQGEPREYDVRFTTLLNELFGIDVGEGMILSANHFVNLGPEDRANLAAIEDRAYRNSVKFINEHTYAETAVKNARLAELKDLHETRQKLINGEDWRGLLENINAATAARAHRAAMNHPTLGPLLSLLSSRAGESISRTFAGQLITETTIKASDLIDLYKTIENGGAVGQGHMRSATGAIGLSVADAGSTAPVNTLETNVKNVASLLDVVNKNFTILGKEGVSANDVANIVRHLGNPRFSEQIKGLDAEDKAVFMTALDEFNRNVGNDFVTTVMRQAVIEGVNNDLYNKALDGEVKLDERQLEAGRFVFVPTPNSGVQRADLETLNKYMEPINGYIKMRALFGQDVGFIASEAQAALSLPGNGENWFDYVTSLFGVVGRRVQSKAKEAEMQRRKEANPGYDFEYDPETRELR